MVIRAVSSPTQDRPDRRNCSAPLHGRNQSIAGAFGGTNSICVPQCEVGLFAATSRLPRPLDLPLIVPVLSSQHSRRLSLDTSGRESSIPGNRRCTLLCGPRRHGCRAKFHNTIEGTNRKNYALPTSTRPSKLYHPFRGRAPLPHPASVWLSCIAIRMKICKQTLQVPVQTGELDGMSWSAIHRPALSRWLGPMWTDYSCTNTNPRPWIGVHGFHPRKKVERPCN